MLRFNSGVESIISTTQRGEGQLTLNYQLGYDMKQALPDVPIDVGEPFVASGGDSGLPGAASALIYAGPGNPVTDMIA
ncbi:MAG: hypothetical protein ACI809_002639 [Candidatus Azotimanducaceae bacterium]|jgi:hypothetical protein